MAPASLGLQVLAGSVPDPVGLGVDAVPATTQVDPACRHERYGVGGRAQASTVGFEVQVGAGHVTGGAHVADDLPGRDRRIEPHPVGSERAVVGVEATAVDADDADGGTAAWTTVAGAPAHG